MSPNRASLSAATASKNAALSLYPAPSVAETARREILGTFSIAQQRLLIGLLVIRALLPSLLASESAVLAHSQSFALQKSNVFGKSEGLKEKGA